ncbi:hypothetical protein [Algoriphagus sp. A40]|uniref:hypothetical protein n=1 Tax=Algoriphagus sp. A40 TaxID=1945863 RepID=UPI00098599E7|nr:hypothetical protein [Algoriphagus sp. A40]OOG78305.1 hypothetical protein B0E43_02580 [Algoriphagus sp. A40]
MSYIKKHSKHGEIYGAILILESELINFFSFLSQHFGEVKINGKTKDGTNISFSSLGEFTSYSNFEKRKIIEFELSCSETDQSVDIKFQNERGIFKPKTLKYNLRYNNQDWGFKFEDDLRQELKEFRPYYNYLTFLDLTFGLPLLLAAILTFIFSLDYLLKFSGLIGFLKVEYIYTNTSQSSWIIGVAWCIPIFLFSYSLNLFRNYLFPVLFIATGKQIKEYQKKKTIAYIIFGIFLMGIVINLISDLIKIN